MKPLLAPVLIALLVGAANAAAVCAGVIKYDVIQRNSGDDFEMDVLLTLASGTEKRIQFKASYLGGPCTSDDQPF